MSVGIGHVIVGAGLAGAKAAQSLRREGWDGHITLVGEEAAAPYNRPPLSKEYLRHSAVRESIDILPEGWYGDHGVDLRTSTVVTSLDPHHHRVHLASGESLQFEKLVLATGSRARRLRVPGAELDGVMYLRTVEDSDRIRQALATSERIVIIGAGWVSLELAAVARSHGLDVTVLEQLQLPLLAALGAEVAPHFAALHLSHGVDLRCNVEVSRITGHHGTVTGVNLADGTHVHADALFVGIGASPRTELAQRAGLAVDDGVLVDAGLRTSHPDIFAVGDIARAWHPLLGRRVRVEHWAAAAWQPRVAARSMLGTDASYDKLPYFYSDQYDVSMEHTGQVDSSGYDRVVFRGDPRTQSYIAFWLKDHRLVAAMNVNTPRVVRDLTALVGSGQRFDVDDLTDDARPLRTLLGA